MNIEIDQPIEEVFAFLSDLENDPKWRREGVEAKRTSDGPIDVGTRSSVFAKVLDRRTEAVYERYRVWPSRAVSGRR